MPAGPVRAELGYIRHPATRPINYMYDPPPGVEKENCIYDFRRVQIEDARSLGAASSVHREGFELRAAPTEVGDFHDEEQIRRIYHAECAQLACAATGGSHAIVFDHLLRQREAGRPSLTFGRHGDGSQPGSVGRVHNDYSDESGQRRLGLVVSDAAAAAAVRRFCIVNIWRSVAGPVLDTPLAVCDSTSVLPGDMVAGEVRYTNRRGEIYLYEYSSQHRWYYHPGMDRHEALIFKQYDSQRAGVARFTPHAAFDLPHIPDGAPLRQSIEVRCLVLFDTIAP